jgi:hypothetical protein
MEKQAAAIERRLPFSMEVSKSVLTIEVCVIATQLHAFSLLPPDPPKCSQNHWIK